MRTGFYARVEKSALVRLIALVFAVVPIFVAPVHVHAAMKPGADAIVQCSTYLDPERSSVLSPSTLSYVNLIRDLTLDRNKLSEEGLSALAAADQPLTVADVARAGLVEITAQELLVMGTAMRRLITAQDFNWAQAKTEIQKIRVVSEGRRSERREAKKETRPAIAPIVREELSIDRLDLGLGWTPSWSSLSEPYTIYENNLPETQFRLLFNRLTKTVVRIDPYSIDIEERGQWLSELSLLPMPDGKVVGAYPQGNKLYVFNAATGRPLHSIPLDDYPPMAWTRFIPYISTNGELRVLSLRDPTSAIAVDFDAATGVARQITLSGDQKYLLQAAPRGEKGVYIIGLRVANESAQFRAEVSVSLLEDSAAVPLLDEPVVVGTRRELYIAQLKAVMFRAMKGDLYLSLGIGSRVNRILNLTTGKRWWWDPQVITDELGEPFFFEDSNGNVKLVVGGVRETFGSSVVLGQSLQILNMTENPRNVAVTTEIAISDELLSSLTFASGVALPREAERGGALLVTPHGVLDLETGSSYVMPSSTEFLGSQTVDGRVEGLWARKTSASEYGKMVRMQLFGPLDEGGTK